MIISMHQYCSYFWTISVWSTNWLWPSSYHELSFTYYPVGRTMNPVQSTSTQNKKSYNLKHMYIQNISNILCKTTSMSCEYFWVFSGKCTQDKHLRQTMLEASATETPEHLILPDCQLCHIISQTFVQFTSYIHER